MIVCDIYWIFILTPNLDLQCFDFHFDPNIKFGSSMSGFWTPDPNKSPGLGKEENSLNGGGGGGGAQKLYISI